MRGPGKAIESILGDGSKAVCAFFGGSTDAIAVRDRERMLVVWNTRFADGIWANCELRVEAGMRVEDYMSAEALSRISSERDQLALALSGAPPRVEFEVQDQDGKPLWFETSWTPIRQDGQVVAVAEIRRDVTARRNTEADVGRSQERFAAIMETRSEFMVCIEMNPPVDMNASEQEQFDHIERFAICVEANHACAGALGYTRSEALLGRPIRDIMPLDIPENAAVFRQAIASGYSFRDVLTYEPDADGEIPLVRNNIRANTRGNQVQLVWAMARDVTEQQRAREQLTRADPGELRRGDWP